MFPFFPSLHFWTLPPPSDLSAVECRRLRWNQFRTHLCRRDIYIGRTQYTEKAESPVKYLQWPKKPSKERVKSDSPHPLLRSDIILAHSHETHGVLRSSFIFGQAGKTGNLWNENGKDHRFPPHQWMNDLFGGCWKCLRAIENGQLEIIRASAEVSLTAGVNISISIKVHSHLPFPIVQLSWGETPSQFVSLTFL